MNLVKVIFDGVGYGHVWTWLPPTGQNRDDLLIRVENLALGDLAQLAADLLGEAQPYTRHEVRNLVRWFMRYGAREFGERPFLRETARALIWDGTRMDGDER